MKIRGNTVGTTLKPEKALTKCQNLTEEEKAIARANIGAAAVRKNSIMPETYLAEGVGVGHYDNMEELFFFDLNGALEVGKRYTVVLNGVEYDTVAIEGHTYNDAWDTSVDLTIDGVFSINYFANGWFGTTDTAAMHQTENLGYDGDMGTPIWKPAVVSIEKQESASGATPDWEQNDHNAPDYIKNRPFYDDTVLNYCVSPQTVTIDSGSSSTLVSINFLPVVGERYIVTVNGTSYDSVAVGDEDVIEVGGGSYTIEFDPDDGEDAIFLALQPGTYTVSVAQKISGGVHPLDEKFLPETVVKNTQTLMMTATFDDGSTATYQLYGKAVG